MRYIDKFPDMEYVFDERDGIIRTTRYVVCCVCGATTEFIELNYEDSFCSEECVAEMDRRAYDSCRCTKAVTDDF